MGNVIGTYPPFTLAARYLPPASTNSYLLGGGGSPVWVRLNLVPGLEVWQVAEVIAHGGTSFPGVYAPYVEPD